MNMRQSTGGKILGVLLLFLLGCSARTSQTGGSSSPPSSSGTVAERSVPMVGKKEVGKTPTHSTVSEERRISLDPLFGIPTQRIHPMDFELGALKPVEPRVQDAVRVAEEFFLHIQRGWNWKELLHPEYRWFLEEELKQWEGFPFREFRLGILHESSSSVIEVPFRVLQERKSFAGSILLEKKQEQWFIADFSLEVNERNRDKEKERFDPFLETR